MAHIDYFFATPSPWTYLAGTRLEEVAARRGATIAYRPLDLIALFARTGGTAPDQRHPSRQEYRGQDLVRQAGRLGMPFNLKPAFWPVNGAPAAYAIIAAAREGGEVGGLTHAITRAVWAEERNIADDAVVRDLLSENGFDPDLTNRGMLVGAETFASNLEQAVLRGVFGAPFYIVAETDQRFWGQDRLDSLDEHLATLAG